MVANANHTASPQLDEHLRQLSEREASLTRERERLQQLTARQLHDIDEATTDLRRQHEALQAERAQFQQHQEQAQRQWQERWQAEWTRLQDRTNEVAKERRALEKLRREANGDIELQRRQLQAGWTDLRKEQQTWQERMTVEGAALARQQEVMAQKQQAVHMGEQALVQERALQEATLLGQRQELGHLEMRIVNWRTQLDGLRGEAALLEAALCHPPPSLLDGAKESKAPSSPAEPVAVPATPREQAQLIELIVQISTGLADQARRLEEHQDRLLELREAWRTTWDVSLAHLAAREEDLAKRELQLRPREVIVEAAELETLKREMMLTRHEQQLCCREVRLEQRRRALQDRRRHMQEAVKSRNVALRRRHQMVRRLRQDWLELRTREGARVLEARTACDRARHEYLTAKESFRRRQQGLDERERRLLQRELVVTQIEQRLVAQDQDPIAAQRVLDRLRGAWEKLVANQLRALARHEADLTRRAGHLDDFRGKLLNERAAIEEQRRTLATTQIDTASERDQLETQRHRLAAELRQLRSDRDLLKQRVRNQEKHLEQLTLFLLGRQVEPVALGLAA